MLKFKFLFAFFLFSFICFCDEVINNFFNQVRTFKEKAQFLRIETIESKISGELNFSEETLKILRGPFQKVFQKELPQEIKVNGYLRGKISPESEKFEFSHLYLYLFSNIESFIFTQIKDDVQVVLPSLGIIMKDKKQNIENLVKSQKPKELDVKLGPLPVNFFSTFFEYLLMKEENIKEKIKFESEGKRENFKTFIYNYPISDGKIFVEILDKFFVLSQVKIINEKDKTELVLYYPIPEKEINIFSFLPNSLSLKGEKDKNKLFLRFVDIQYNKLFSENDFKIKEMNFPELITSIYIKILK
ncbi:MAG: hypothetical protein NC922_04220 [Candidatus Omnitrophica bacterium]|nr:hypothetical protein [Candidatus Omnitrophota bacterium]